MEWAKFVSRTSLRPSLLENFVKKWPSDEQKAIKINKDFEKKLLKLI